MCRNDMMCLHGRVTSGRSTALCTLFGVFGLAVLVRCQRKI